MICEVFTYLYIFFNDDVCSRVSREDVEWGGSGCKVTVLVFRDGERVNMLRVKENHDGTYSPLEHSKLCMYLTPYLKLPYK